MEAHSARTLKKAKQQMAALKLKGVARKEQGAVAPVILKHAPKQDGPLVVGSQGLDVSTASCSAACRRSSSIMRPGPVLVVKGEAAPLRRITLATDGSSASATALEFVLTRFQPNRSTGKGGRVPIHVSVIHVMVPSVNSLVSITIRLTIPWIKSPGLTEANPQIH